MKTKAANPQGKGLVSISGFVTSLNSIAVAPAKNIQQLANDLFTSMFVLHSDFKFKPVIGKKYWLYQSEKGFRLSLVSPEEWRGTAFGTAIGCCELHSDLTWTLALTESTQQNTEFMSMIEKRKNEFDQQLQAVEKVIDILPHYQNQLPFYQRAYSTALAHSLKVSIFKSGIAMLPPDQAQSLQYKP